ncbi:MAG TPA: nucleotidyltransferase domain-containing protein [Campylobacterales bacterium]|nr:nucleotidyltransferase domain-containing protein [Campylobacterales bacterium]
MRLSEKEIKLIKQKVKSVFGEAVIYLFGSRLDDSKRGGDIDLYIITPTKDNLFSKKRRLKLILEDVLYKPIDVIVSIDKNRPIEKEAAKGVTI